MVLVMIAKVKAGQKREEPIKLIGASIVMIGERIFVSMGSVSSKIEKLYGGQNGGDGPHDDCVQIARAQQQVDNRKAKQDAELAPAKIGQEKF